MAVAMSNGGFEASDAMNSSADSPSRVVSPRILAASLGISLSLCFSACQASEVSVAARKSVPDELVTTQGQQPEVALTTNVTMTGAPERQAHVGKRGWIFVGSLTSDGKGWATEPEAFVVVDVKGKTVAKDVVPMTGDLIRFTERAQELVVPAFAEHGWAHVADPGEALRREDFTGVLVPSGTTVTVEKTLIRPGGEVQGVWFRVVSGIVRAQ